MFLDELFLSRLCNRLLRLTQERTERVRIEMVIILPSSVKT